MTILVVAEHTNAALAAATLNTVAAAQKIGGDIHVLVVGANAGAAAEAAAAEEAALAEAQASTSEASDGDAAPEGDK